MIHDLVNTGKAVIVFREFPLSGPYHKYAREAANIATAAARIGKYSRVSDTLFKTQQEWAETGKVWDWVAPVLSADDLAKVKSLSTEPDVLAEVERDYRAGASAGVNQTPTIMVISQRTGRRWPVSGIPPNYATFRDFVLKDVN